MFFLDFTNHFRKKLFAQYVINKTRRFDVRDYQILIFKFFLKFGSDYYAIKKCVIANLHIYIYTTRGEHSP